MSPQKTKKTEKKSTELIQTVSATDFSDFPRHQMDPVSFSTWIRQLLQNWRQGTAACKGRSEVNFSNKKPWKQKGTGRARAGSARSPLWRKGGVIFGPQPRTRTLSVAQQLKKGVLNNLFWQYLDEGKIVCLDWTLSSDVPKTADAYNVLKTAGLHEGKTNLFLSMQDQLHYASLMNLENVRVVFFDAGNAYDLVNADRWVVLKKDFDAFKQMVSQWN